MPHLPRRALLAAPLLLPALARAAFPERALSWIVPFGPGSITDTSSRLIATAMGQALGQTIVVENRPGAGGSIATEAFARTAPDGYAVLYGTTGTHAVQPVINRNVRYDAIADFTPVHGLGASPNLLVVAPGKPWRAMAELVEHARRHPDTLNYGSSGTGTSLHLCGELLARETGIRINHIPYTVGAQALTDLLGGRLDFLFDFPLTSLAHVREGRLRPLAVTAPQRLAPAPEIPTTAEVGFPSVVLSSWAALFVPARTPPELVARLEAAATVALRDPRVVEYHAQSATALFPEMGAAGLAAMLRADIPRLRALLERTQAG